MAFNYDEEFIEYIFHVENPSDLDPGTSRLEQFDNDLFSIYEEVLLEKLPPLGIPTDRATKSKILLLAFFSNGGVKVQVNNACKYFLNVTGED